jgi:hypothetical protein
MPASEMAQARHFRITKKEVSMRMHVCLVLLAVVPLSSYAAGKPCQELKAEIQAKLAAKNVAKYSLEIMGKDVAQDGKTVGTCEGGTKKIVYSKK